MAIQKNWTIIFVFKVIMKEMFNKQGIVYFHNR